MNTPTLGGDRVAAMRTSVMHAVDRDISRRGRHTRRTMGLAAAGVLVVAFGSVGIRALDGGTTAESAGESSSAGDSALQDDGPAGARKEAAPHDGRQVITTGTVTVTVAQPRVVAQKISAYVERLGGRVDSRTESGSGTEASASVTVRVPSDEVTATIDRLATYGTVDDVAVQHDDVTARSEDLDARIDALRLSIDRLGRILADADTSAELIKAETALTKRQEQLESLQAQRQGIADQVQLSTLTIELSQKAGAESVEPGGFVGGLTQGWNALVSTLNQVVQVAGTVLPWAAVVAALYAAYRLVSRRRTSA
jgi:hypothetical protein